MVPVPLFLLLLLPFLLPFLLLSLLRVLSCFSHDSVACQLWKTAGWLTFRHGVCICRIYCLVDCTDLVLVACLVFSVFYTSLLFCPLKQL